MKCPLIINQHGDLKDCERSKCMFTDDADDCLIKQALQCYVAKERTAMAEDNHFETIYKNGLRELITFYPEGSDI